MELVCMQFMKMSANIVQCDVSVSIVQAVHKNVQSITLVMQCHNECQKLITNYGCGESVAGWTWLALRHVRVNEVNVSTFVARNSFLL